MPWRHLLTACALGAALSCAAQDITVLRTVAQSGNLPKFNVGDAHRPGFCVEMLHAIEATDSALRFEGLEIDTARREVKSERGLLELTGTEYELLVLLAREPGRGFSRDDILNRLRGQEAELLTRAVDILVSRLRRKLEPLAALKTLRNAGYCFALPEKS